jgi:hypothetical protein
MSINYNLPLTSMLPQSSALSQGSSSGLLSTILMMAMSGKLGCGAAQNPKTDTIISAITSAGKKNKTTQEDIENQLSIFNNQLSMMQMFTAIPQFAPYISPMIANIKAQQGALQLVDDNFDAFAGTDGDDNVKTYINTKANSDDIANIRDAAETDDNAADFSEEDLAGLYDLQDMDYAAPFDMSMFDGAVEKDSKNYTFKDKSEKTYKVTGTDEADTYTVKDTFEDSNLLFEDLNSGNGDKLTLEGEWTAEQITGEDDEDYVLYTNEETGTNVYVAGSKADVAGLVTGDNIEWAEGTDGGDGDGGTGSTMTNAQAATIIANNYDTLNTDGGYLSGAELSAALSKAADGTDLKKALTIFMANPGNNDFYKTVDNINNNLDSAIPHDDNTFSKEDLLKYTTDSALIKDAYKDILGKDNVSDADINTYLKNSNATGDVDGITTKDEKTAFLKDFIASPQGKVAISGTTVDISTVIGIADFFNVSSDDKAGMLWQDPNTIDVFIDYAASRPSAY